MALHRQSCLPCRDGQPPLAPAECRRLLSELQDWHLVENHHLCKRWSFADFASALAFLQQAAEVCEAENHHAEFELGWGRLQAKIWTHQIDGLTASDFVLAAKFDRLTHPA
ncbi:MAG: 4a-hydroxytetrahydrobiopterin dehydratase [Planctomycetota bacterium]|nr:MAG: 4a-hydroxytetrahydrobiopterin dehydratase [Planctomycetota bacterium]